MPDRMPDKMPDGMPEDMPDKVPEWLPDRMPEDLPDNMPEDMPDRMPEGIPDKVPECLPDRMPEDLPDNMPEDMPDRMPEDMPEHMPGRMPEDMPDRMPEGMPDRIPDKVSDRMPEDLPVTKCINVMVGITRSKVIFSARWFCSSVGVQCNTVQSLCDFMGNIGRFGNSQDCVDACPRLNWFKNVQNNFCGPINQSINWTKLPQGSARNSSWLTRAWRKLWYSANNFDTRTLKANHKAKRWIVLLNMEFWFTSILEISSNLRWNLKTSDLNLFEVYNHHNHHNHHQTRP